MSGSFTSGGAGGTASWKFILVDSLTRVEVERLIRLQELDVVRIECSSLTAWVGPVEGRAVWLEAVSQLDDSEDWGQSPKPVSQYPFSGRAVACGGWSARSGHLR